MKTLFRLPTNPFETVARLAQLGTLASLMVLSAFALRSGAWQLWGIVATTLLLLLLLDFSIFLSRQGHLILALWLLFLGGELAFLTGGALIANLGWMLGLSITALISIMSLLLLPQPQRMKAIATALVTALLLLGLDVLAPAYRLEFPVERQAYLFLLFMLVGGGFSIYYVRQLNPSLRARLLTTLFFLTLAPLGLSALIASTTLETRLRQNLFSQLQADAQLTGQQVDEFFASTLNMVKAHAQLPQFLEFLKSTGPKREEMLREVDSTLLTLSRQNPIYVLSYALLDENGKNVADSIFLNIGTLEGDRDYFLQPVRTGQPYVSPVNARTNLITFSAPVRDERGRVLGVLRLHYNAAVLQQLMVKDRGLAGPQSFAILVDENGIILAHGDDSAANFKLLAPLPQDQFKALQAEGRLPSGTAEQLSLNVPALVPLLQGSTTGFAIAETHPAGGHREIVIAYPLDTRPWKVFYAQDERAFSTPLRRQFLLFSFLIFIVSVVGAMVALVLANRLLSPLTLLTQAAQRVQQGDFSIRVGLQGRDETGVLADAFNTMTGYIAELVGSLERRVAERTRELEERSEALQRAVEVGSLIASTLDPQQLVQQAVELIRERFGLYYVGLFELDGSGEWAILRAGSGEAGKILLARGHRIRVGTGMIGWSIAHDQPRIAQQAELDEVRLRIPELSQTRSEAALPIRSRGQVLGALSIQSDQPNAFTPENLAIFQLLAEQLGIALDNAYLFAESQATLRSLEQAYAERTRADWRQALLSLRMPLAFRSAARGSLFIEPLQAPDALRALRNGEVVVETESPSSAGRSFINVPIRIRGYVIGLLRTYKPAERGPWSEEEIEALKTIAEQVGVALEVARLYGDTQRRAERERLLAEITTKIRSVSDPQGMIQVAMEALRQALNVKDVKFSFAPVEEKGENGR